MQPVLQDSYRPTSNAAIQQFETRERLELPSDYRKWLIESNGGAFCDHRALATSTGGDTFCPDLLYGIDTGFDYADLSRLEWTDSPQTPSVESPVILPFVRDAGGGTLGLLFESPFAISGIVEITSPECEVFHTAWRSFADFLNSIGENPDYKTPWDNGPDEFRLIVRESIEEIRAALGTIAVNKPDTKGESLLSAALFTGRPDVVRLLLDQGANPSLSDLRGYTPLHVCASCGALDAACMLLHAGARIDAADENGNTPIMLATAYSHTRVALLLIERGANLKLINRRGEGLRAMCRNYYEKEHVLPLLPPS